MTDLIAARGQMAMSLAFHIVFAVIGLAMPLMMVIGEFRWFRTGDPVYLLLAKRWAKGAAILFVIGAISGTVLSFELGLLWPRFMAAAGALVGMPFSIEGFAFFMEAIFLGIYLYGWDRVSARVHLLCGVMVALSGLSSAVFVTFVNAWMNTPTGFHLAGGRFTDINPYLAMRNPAAIPEAIHMVLAGYCAVGFATVGIHAWLLLRNPGSPFHQRAVKIGFAVGAAAVLLQSVSGDALARMVARYQPAKLASLEGQFQTESGAPLRIGGLPDVAAQNTRYAIEIPSGLSLLAFHDPHATVRGLSEFPQADWPPVVLVHLCFQTMVGTGSILSLVAIAAIWAQWRRKGWLGRRRVLWTLVAVSPLGFVALEAGWMVTELGRQPWIIHSVMRTADAVTETTHLVPVFLTVTALYCCLGAAVVWLLTEHVIQTPASLEVTRGGVHVS